MNFISNIKEFSVSELNYAIKNIVEYNFNMIKVKGEVSQINKHSSGHVYFTLKDGKSIISAICWRSCVPKLNIEIENGIHVVVKGRITTYDPQSKYQIIIDQIDYEGEGTLLKLLEDRKKKLALQGFFDQKRKKKIPKIPSKIGVITSETGAVINDIIHRLSERYPIELLVFQANVQGSKSLQDLIDGINYFNKSSSPPDVIIIARGGGSLEDLMPFNEVRLVKAISMSSIPLISAVGHETDFTLCDLVADLRAPTPTAAAEFVVPDRNDLFYKIKSNFSLINNIFQKKISDKKLNLKVSITKLPEFENLINTNYQSLDFFEKKIYDLLIITLKNSKINFFQKTEKFNKEYLLQKLENFKSMISLLNNNIKVQLNIVSKFKKNQIISAERQLSLLSYKSVLKRGFSVIRYKNKLVQDETKLKKGVTFDIEFYESKFKAKKI